jgi:hypothetical protein
MSLISSHVPVRPMIAGWNSERYSERTPGVSRAGSQVMKMGRRGGSAEEEVDEEERRGEALTSSSGQISGQ